MKTTKIENQANEKGFTAVKTTKGLNLTAFALTLSERDAVVNFIRKDILGYRYKHAV